MLRQQLKISSLGGVIVIEDKYKNLYFVGAGCHPGVGVPGVISSAKVLENIIKNE